MKTRYLLTGTVLCTLIASAPAQPDNIGHTRHHHRHGEPHPAEVDPRRFFTNRTGADLPLPGEEEAFFFVVFGDRTGGPAEGVSVLADAVRDTNLLEPDFVMTVGDLVEGYNQSGEWMEQTREFKEIMDRLLCPWFPVAGNHDIYWRGEGRPPGEHEAEYEMHFGPLWYAFTHKNCLFIALYSDEGNPETGEKNFNKPECQVMSEAQFSWLKETLQRGRDMDHIFLFLHHPRWLGGNYGDDWEKVHRELVAAGNVTAVFAGHIHRMRYDPRDGIEYVALATVGGGQSHVVPEAGWLHQYHIVTVRKNQIALAAVPVGEVMDVREITGALADEAAALARQAPEFGGPLSVASDGSADGDVTVRFRNTASLPIEVMVAADSDDSRWSALPDHTHRVVEPGGVFEYPFRVRRMANSFDDAFRPIRMVVSAEMLASGHRYAIPDVVADVPLDLHLPRPATPSGEGVLTLDGRTGCLRVESEQLDVPDGPMTLECWFNARSFGERVGLLAKTENSEYGFFVSGGVPEFDIHLGPTYVVAKGDGPMLETDRWHHIAGVFDGNETRLYVDGRLVSTVARSGERRTNRLPLYVGADVDGRGNPTSFFDGRIDGVRVSTVARYAGESFTPSRRHAPDEHTALLLNMDGRVAAWAYDESPEEAHPGIVGGAEIRVEP